MLLNIAIGIFYDLLDPQVDFLGVKPLIDNQSVQLVENKASFDLKIVEEVEFEPAIKRSVD